MPTWKGGGAMRRGRCSIGWLAAVVLPLASTALWAGPGLWGPPDGYVVGGRDEAPVYAEGPSGTVWSAWAWYERGEYDLAVAFRGADGVWGEPRFLGRNDGLDQRDATIAVDSAGTLYVAFTVEPLAEVHLAILPAWSDSWILPARVGEEGIPARHPTIRVLDGRVVLAFLAGRETRIEDFITLPRPQFEQYETKGIQEGPDVIDPLGRASDREDESSDRDRRGNRPGDHPEETEIRPGLGEPDRRK